MTIADLSPWPTISHTYTPFPFTIFLLFSKLVFYIFLYKCYSISNFTTPIKFYMTCSDPTQKLLILNENLLCNWPKTNEININLTRLKKCIKKWTLESVWLWLLCYFNTNSITFSHINTLLSNLIKNLPLNHTNYYFINLIQHLPSCLSSLHHIISSHHI